MPVVNGSERVIERFTLVKGLRAITLLNLIQKMVPDMSSRLAEFIHTYREDHVVEYDRIQAKMRFGGNIPVVSDGEPVLDADGKIVTIPAPIDALGEEDWARVNHVYRRAEDPPVAAMVAAILPDVLAEGEAPVMRLLAIALISNDDFLRYARDGVWQEKADAVVRDVLEPAYIDEVMELAVSVVEVLEGQVLDKVEQLGDRTGKALGRFGIKLNRSGMSEESSELAEDTNSTGSTLSPNGSSGTPGSPSHSLGTLPSDSQDDGPRLQTEKNLTEHESET